MARLRGRLTAGEGGWLHACHCCDAGAPSAPWGAWSWPGATSVERQGVVAEVRVVPGERRGVVGCWGRFPTDIYVQVPDVLRTRYGRLSAASSAAVLRRRPSR